MTRLILKSLNPVALVLVTIFGMALQTSLFAWWPLNYIQPDVILLVVIWCALRRDFTEGGILTLILAEIGELHSASPQGVFLISYMVLYLGVRLTARLLVLPDLSSLILVTLFSSVGWKLVTVGVMDLLSPTTSHWQSTLLLLFPGAAVDGILAIWAYRWLEKFDFVTYKSKRNEEALEAELEWNRKGF